MDSRERDDKGASWAPIVGGGRGADGALYRDPRATEGGLFLAIGGALALVGVVDLSLLWYPVQLGNAGWEFATVSRTFTNAPMTAVGLVLMALGLVRLRMGPRVIRGVAIGFATLSFLLVAMGVLFAMSAPAVLFQTDDQTARSALTRAIMKNGVEILVYPTALLGIAFILWRGVKEGRTNR